MTKEENCDAIVKEIKSSRVETLAIVEAFMRNIRRCLERGEVFEVRNFGRFEFQVRKQKKARDIVRGVSFIIPERKVPVFVFSKTYSNKLIEINNGEQGKKTHKQ